MCCLKMENELQFTSFDEEFITVEVELKSTTTDEELKCTAMEDEIKCSTIEEEIKCTVMEDEVKCTAIEEELKLSCPVCDKTFNNIKVRNHHMRRVHNVVLNVAKKNIICPLSNCRERFFHAQALRKHIVQTHQIDLSVEEKTFRSYDDFAVWKENMEKETKSHYVKRHINRVLITGKTVLKDYFACDRSGFYTPNGTGKRNGRRLGTKKIGAFCPSSLVVTHSTVNSYVKVVHWRTHLGHTCDMNHLSLTESEKMEIAEKISRGMTFSEILASFRDSVSGPELHRINCLSRRDLSNIVQRFKLRRNKFTENDDDLVNLWVTNMEEFGNDTPVAFFKKQGIENEQLNLEDFMIVIMTKYQKEMAIKYSGKNICIDSIHGVNSHGFSLTTLLTIDELSTVLPLAFCISSKTDEASMMVFFESVKRLVGIIETPVFMSNDDSAFYNAWEKIMAPASFQLLCPWHVDSCWRRELNKINDENKQSSVYRTLKMLLEECDVFEFESSINNFVTELEDDDSTREFADYFCKNYLPRVKMWAFCYMRHLGISTVEHIEALHTSLKNLFLDGGEDNVYNSQVNIAIPALLKLSRDKLLDRLDELLECLPIDWTNKIRRCHQQGFKVHKITALDNSSWSVKLHKRVGGHVVTTNKACSNEDCYLQCTKCNICIHSFFCTCFDNLINLNLCGHIHACVIYSTASKPVEDGVVGKKEKMTSVITGENEIADTVASNGEVIERSVEHNSVSSKTLLTDQLSTIKTVMECTEYTEEQANQLKNSFDAIISFMIMHGKSKKPFIHVPYKPTKNYLNTVNKKSEIQYQNQMVTIGQPLCLYMLNSFK